MNTFLDVTAILVLSVASLQMGLFLGWGVLTVILNSLQRVGSPGTRK